MKQPMLLRKAPVLLGVAVAAIGFLGKAIAEEPKTITTLLTESFDDADLLKRHWYDGSHYKIVADEPFAGKGCIEYGWKEKATSPHTSSGARYSIKATDQLFIRFYIKLPKDWDWSGRSYHPHLAHFLTTENGKWHGPARSHLTLY